MPKISSIFVCQKCEYKSPSFLGKCPECQSWNSLIEERQQATGDRKQVKQKAEIVNLFDVEKYYFERISCNIDEFDRVLGGGIVKGAVMLAAGDPGIGKSTLLLQLALNVNQAHNSVLYVAGEESAYQIKLRADRITKNAKLSILNEVDVDLIIQAIKDISPSLIIIDSIQTLETSDLASSPGSISQVRECAYRLQRVAKKMHVPIFLIGHITKEGDIAGPKTLEHLVDVVLSLEGDSINQFRILRSTKNRFGPTDEIGIFEMGEKGMVAVKDSSLIFLEENLNEAGSAVAALQAGLRPMMIEIQALVSKSSLSFPRRVGNGIDINRLQLLVAVVSKRLSLPLFDKDIFVNVTGGIKLSDPAADLAVCMAVTSALKEQVIKPKTVFIGEVGLLGELRPTRQVEKRAKEAKKLGFTNIISFQNAKSLKEALKLAFSGFKHTLAT